jgi:hypothetical protein
VPSNASTLQYECKTPSSEPFRIPCTTAWDSFHVPNKVQLYLWHVTKHSPSCTTASSPHSNRLRFLCGTMSARIHERHDKWWKVHYEGNCSISEGYSNLDYQSSGLQYSIFKTGLQKRLPFDGNKTLWSRHIHRALSSVQGMWTQKVDIQTNVTEKRLELSLIPHPECKGVSECSNQHWASAEVSNSRA